MSEKFVANRKVCYGAEVWVSQGAEAIRKEHCLCLNCGKMKPGSPDHCPIAQKLYELCCAGNLAMAISRCPQWEPKKSD